MDKENKAIYKILKASFEEGSPELATVMGIPMEGEDAANSFLMWA